MALSDRQIRRQTEERVVKITEVNTDTGYVGMLDQYGTQLRASLDFSTPLIAIPAIGDTWIAQRRSTSWYLVRQSNIVSELSAYGPGDRSLIAPGNLNLAGQNVTINGASVGLIAPKTFAPTWSASPVTNGGVAWAELVVPGCSVGDNVVISGGATARLVLLFATVYQTNGVRVSLRNDSGGNITPPATLYLSLIG